MEENRLEEGIVREVEEHARIQGERNSRTRNWWKSRRAVVGSGKEARGRRNRRGSGLGLKSGKGIGILIGNGRQEGGHW